MEKKKDSVILRIILTVVVGIACNLNQVTAESHDVHSDLYGEFFNTSSKLVTDTDQQERALSWVKSMMQPPKMVGDGSSVTVDSAYSYDYVGEMTGSVILSGEHKQINRSHLTVVSPDLIVDSYRGIVSGKLEGLSPAENYEVRAYLYTDSEYDQSYFVKPAVVNPNTGSWSLDLSTVPNFAGSWRFKLHKVVDGLSVGDSWTGAYYYEHLKVRSYSLTTSEHFIEECDLNSELKWSLKSQPGEKIIRVIDTSTGTILAEYFNPTKTGLIRSYQYEDFEPEYNTSQKYLSFTYDQATTLLVAVGEDDRQMADLALKGLLSAQIKSGEHQGAFLSHVFQFYKGQEKTSIYTGINAFASYSLMRYYEKYGNQNDLLGALKANLEFIEGRKIVSGNGRNLYKGGLSYDDSSQTYKEIDWSSTEHNTDLWHVFERVGRSVDSSYLTKANDLEKSIMTNLWNIKENRFNQGLNDDAQALDTNSWGSIFLNGVGEYEKAKLALAETDNFVVTEQGTTGYFAYLNTNSPRTIWYEGTFGVALAQNVAGNKRKSLDIINNAYQKQAADGAWRYTLNEDSTNEMSHSKSVASTNWYLLVSKYPNIIWSECRVIN
ncbi:hypothetical protein I6N95_15610 [Vagococcus sp. BWB3-3]|uniref:Uncharacterized protein n=1 Tax=Vagococcus allomyrinae TaxID=2794353 RepID=A0A940PCT7_9ENTE|nr:hypothetical protein [Vagococcus allomyrinae]MBP1042445.1 hypothetical protein [Vagococcus allomyrinae]